MHACHIELRARARAHAPALPYRRAHARVAASGALWHREPACARPRFRANSLLRASLWLAVSCASVARCELRLCGSL
eukprot:751716-Pleurochrysis_carterae.AAC.1